MGEALSGTERRWETASLLLSTSMATWGPGGWRVKSWKLRALQLILIESSGLQRATGEGVGGGVLYRPQYPLE